MSDITYVILFALLGGLLSLIGGVLLLVRKVSVDTLTRFATPFAAGALLAAVFLDLLKEGIELDDSGVVMYAALSGIVIFFLAERFLHWFHHHHQHEGADPSRALIITGDIIHNALDGIAIAAAFLISVPTGIITTLAVAAHEVPQEIGEFGLLLAKGMSRKRVLVINVLSTLATVVTATVTYIIGSEEQLPLGLLLGLSAGFLLYIALSDIIPDIHERSTKKKLFDWQPVMLILGVVLVGAAITVAHNYLGHDHGHESATSQHADGEHLHEEEHHDNEHSQQEKEHDEHHDADHDEPKVCIMIYPPPEGCE